MTTTTTMPVLAGEFYLCLHEDEIAQATQHVRRGTQGWGALKGSVEEAFSRYCWRHPDRAALEAALAHVRCLRLSLTHAGAFAQVRVAPS